MTYALILVFLQANGHSHTVDPGRSYATEVECQQAAAATRGYISLREGEVSFTVRCVKR
jgi:hypothetical protein